jgi:spermidine synthase
MEPGNPRYLSFLYTRWIGESIAAIRPGAPLDAVFVGGGGFTLPRWLEATRPGSRSNVLEVDGKLVEFDRRHFGLHTSTNLRATIGDARVTIRREPTNSADVVVGDAFSGLTVPWQMMTTEWLQEVKRVLRPDGIYAVNIIDESPLKLLRAEAATILPMFTKVGMITFVDRQGHPNGGNAVVFASDGPLPPEHGSPEDQTGAFDRAAIVRLVAGAEPLRDDYAPVDQLETRPVSQVQTTQIETTPSTEPRPH